MNETLHIKIINDYAVNVISDLKTLEAAEVLADDETVDIPQWQIDKGRKIKDYYDKNSNELLRWAEIRKKLKFS